MKFNLYDLVEANSNEVIVALMILQIVFILIVFARISSVNEKLSIRIGKLYDWKDIIEGYKGTFGYNTIPQVLLTIEKMNKRIEMLEEYKDNLCTAHDKLISISYSYVLNNKIKNSEIITDEFMEHYRNLDSEYILDLLRNRDNL